MWYLFAALSVFGHMAVCIWVVNRLHATAMPHWFLKVIDRMWYAFLLGLPVAVAAWLVIRPSSGVLQWERIRDYSLSYGAFCSIIGVLSIFIWMHFLSNHSTTEQLIANHTEVIDMPQKLGSQPTGTKLARVLANLPNNQVFQLSIHKKTLEVPTLPEELDGMTITHISDLHFTGQVTRPYFDQVIREANRLKSDFNVITGDIIDKPKCMPWLTGILGDLKKQAGTFYVLGNHDLRVKDEKGVRNALGENGFIDLGGKAKVVSYREHPIFWGGNEIPWFPNATDVSHCPVEVKGKTPFRILLSHSPDQIQWAMRNGFELMFAGHTHGGQIRFPVVGPVFSPSRFGVTYASGTFYCEPTVLHVSRGLSGTRMLRYNCRPELTQVTLKCGTANNDPLRS